MHDGHLCVVSDSERRVKQKKFRLLGGESTEVVNTPLGYKWVIKDAVCYNATHANHPSAVWARETDRNYIWLVELFEGCLREYQYRYRKVHSATKLVSFFKHLPRNIPRGEQTQFPQAMPQEFQVKDDPIAAYQAFYLGSKIRFAKWTKREVPSWFAAGLKGQDVANFQRTRAVDL